MKIVPIPPRFASQPVLLSWLLLFGLVCTGCVYHPLPQVTEVPGTTSPVSSQGKTDLEALALLLLIEDRRSYDPLSVDQALAGDTKRRARLATALGRTGHPEGLLVLRELLMAPEVEVRRAAAFATAGAAIRGLPPSIDFAETGGNLARAAADPDPEVGRWATLALAAANPRDDTIVVGRAVATAEITEEAGLERVLLAVHALGDSVPDMETRVTLAVAALEQLPAARYEAGADPEGSSNAQQRNTARRNAAQAMTIPASGPISPAALRTLLGDPDPWVAGLAARAMGGQELAASDVQALLDFAVLSIEAAGDEPVEARAPPSDTGSLDDPSSTEPSDPPAEPRELEERLPEGRSGHLFGGVEALRAAGAALRRGVTAPPPSFRAHLLPWLDHPLPRVRLSALAVVDLWLHDATLEERLRDLARIDPGGLPVEPPSIASAAVRALIRTGDREMADVVATAGRSRHEVLRAAAAPGAVAFGLDNLVLDLTVDPRASVRWAASESILETAYLAGISDIVDWLEPVLADSSPVVRTSLLRWLAGKPIARVDEVYAALSGSAATLGVEVRLAAIDAFAALAVTERMQRGGAIGGLEALLEDPSWPVRRHAARSLTGLGRETRPPGGPEVKRGSAWYRALLEGSAGDRDFLFELETNKGTMRLRLDCEAAPTTCNSIRQLAAQGYYTDLPLFARDEHSGQRLNDDMPEPTLYFGDSRGDGRGGAGYLLRDEPVAMPFDTPGVLASDPTVPDAGGGRLSLTLSPQPWRSGVDPAIGKVVSGHQVLDLLGPGDRVLSFRPVP